MAGSPRKRARREQAAAIVQRAVAAIPEIEISSIRPGPPGSKLVAFFRAYLVDLIYLDCALFDSVNGHFIAVEGVRNSYGTYEHRAFLTETLRDAIMVQLVAAIDRMRSGEQVII